MLFDLTAPLDVFESLGFTINPRIASTPYLLEAPGIPSRPTQLDRSAPMPNRPCMELLPYLLKTCRFLLR